MYIYLVLSDGKISSEAYLTFEEAEKFIKSRSDKPINNDKTRPWVYFSSHHIYAIKEVKVCL